MHIPVSIPVGIPVRIPVHVFVNLSMHVRIRVDRQASEKYTVLESFAFPFETFKYLRPRACKTIDILAH